jgi:hypothetical protein
MNPDIEVSVKGDTMYAKGVSDKGKGILADLFFTLDLDEGYPFGAGMVDKFKETFTDMGFVVHIVS